MQDDTEPTVMVHCQESPLQEGTKAISHGSRKPAHCGRGRGWMEVDMCGWLVQTIVEGK